MGEKLGQDFAWHAGARTRGDEKILPAPPLKSRKPRQLAAELATEQAASQFCIEQGAIHEQPVEFSVHRSQIARLP